MKLVKELKLFLLLGFLVGDAGPLTLFAQPSPVAKASASGLHLAISVQGPVTVQRPGWSGRAPLVFGTYLQLGDLLRVDESAHVRIVCSDLTVHDVPAGIVGVPCGGTQPLIRSADGTLINPTRNSGGSSSFPLVLSPRKTKVLSLHPLLRWTPVEGADNYRIIIRGPNLLWARETGLVTKLHYPEGAPELKAGMDYKLIVEANGHSSSNEPGLGLGFSILGNDERKAVSREQRKIDGLGLPSGPAKFLTAHLYAANGLNSEAIELLEDVSERFQVSAVYRALGDLYLAAGLTRQAEAAYINSLNLSHTEGDQEGEMLAHLALGQIYETLGNRKLACQHLEASMASASKIGDRQTAGRAQRQLAELNARD